MTATDTTTVVADYTPTLALSMRQPWAELILRGVKRFEHRSRLTHVRGRILIYASLGRYARDTEADIEAESGIELDGLPRGVNVGSVELFDGRPATAGNGGCGSPSGQAGAEAGEKTAAGLVSGVVTLVDD
jgi:hypothetical protein